MTIHDVNSYVELGALAPEPEESGDCPDCGNYYCPPGCRPRFVSPYTAARSRERLENGDPDS